MWNTDYTLFLRKLCVHACSVVSNSLQSRGLWPTRLICPWHSPGKNTGAGCHLLLQGISLTEGSNPCLLHSLHWQVDSLPLHHLGNPIVNIFLGKSEQTFFQPSLIIFALKMEVRPCNFGYIASHKV